MNGCTHPYRGTTDNPAWVVCEICGDALRADTHPANMSIAVYAAMLEAKARYADTVFGPLLRGQVATVDEVEERGRDVILARLRQISASVTKDNPGTEILFKQAVDAFHTVAQMAIESGDNLGSVVVPTLLQTIAGVVAFSERNDVDDQAAAMGAGILMIRLLVAMQDESPAIAQLFRLSIPNELARKMGRPHRDLH
jgi:hypothetical protein